MIKHTSGKISESENLLGIRNGKKVFLCTHESTKSSEDQHYELQFYDVFQKKRDSLLEALTTYPSDYTSTEPLQARVVVFRGFTLNTQGKDSLVCVKRDHIRAAVFAQVDTLGGDLQHYNLMLQVASAVLGNVLSQETLCTAHRSLPHFARRFDAHHLFLLQNILHQIVINTGALLGWQTQPQDPRLCKPNGVNDSDFDELDDGEMLLNEKDLQFLKPSSNPDYCDDDYDEFYEQICVAHSQRVRDLFSEIQLLTAWNAHGAGSLMDYAEEHAPYYQEAIDDRIRMKLVDELAELDH